MPHLHLETSMSLIDYLQLLGVVSPKFTDKKLVYGGHVEWGHVGETPDSDLFLEIEITVSWDELAAKTPGFKDPVSTLIDFLRKHGSTDGETIEMKLKEGPDSSASLYRGRQEIIETLEQIVSPEQTPQPPR